MSRTVEPVSTELFVDDTGEPHLPVVLCLHSLFMDGRMFDSFAESARGRYRVVRPDFRGQGRSPEATRDINTMDECADDIEAVVDALGLSGFHLLMQSMGGDVGFRVAHRRPELVRSMVVLGSSACAEPPEQLERFRKFVDDFHERGFVDDLLELLTEVMFGTTTRSNPAKADLVEHWRRHFASLPRELTPAFAGVIERESVVDLLPDLSAPALIVSGAEDMPRPPAWADEVQEQLPDADLWRLQGVGHSPILEAPELVLPRILAFFDRVEATADVPGR
jgi:3-oxoadipate enol-lactonase